MAVNPFSQILSTENTTQYSGLPLTWLSLSAPPYDFRHEVIEKYMCNTYVSLIKQ